MSGVLRPGHNCWRVERANRFALLVDASNFYGAVSEAMSRARRSIVLLGWDLDTRTELYGNDPAESTGPLRDFLRRLVNDNENLDIYVLPWSFPLLFAHVRDPKLVRGEDPFEHPRIHFKMDDLHPPGGSHHQKIVMVDGNLAFAGGMDLAGGRWDTPEHLADDPRRGGSEPYPPSHDVQAMLDGDAAVAIGEIARERWRRATGTSVAADVSSGDAWPVERPADLTGVNVGISRTDPLIHCREVEQLHLDLIAAARASLYIENQYFTSPMIVNALSRRLQEAGGPEIVMVLPLNNHGWLENHTLEALRFRRVRELREADRFGRLRICYPTVRGLQSEDESIVVHSKILVADDRCFRVGSANLSDRSLRLDTECDLTIEAEDERQQAGIARLRNRLLGEHLALSAEQVSERLLHDPSLIRLIDACSTQTRCLRELPDHGGATQILSTGLIDPPQPLTPLFVVRTVADSAVRSQWCWGLAGLAAGAGLTRFLLSRFRR